MRMVRSQQMKRGIRKMENKKVRRLEIKKVRIRNSQCNFFFTLP